MKKGNIFFHALLFGMWIVMHGVLVLLAIAMFQEKVLADGWVLLLSMSVLWTGLILLILRSCPEVTLSESGIDVKRLWIRRHYAWDELIQAGILQKQHRYGFYNALLLLKTGGSRRRYQDKTFLLRNGSNLIEVPNTEENRQLVRQHYGPLDFDLSDGRLERSIVVDELFSVEDS